MLLINQQHSPQARLSKELPQNLRKRIKMVLQEKTLSPIRWDILRTIQENFEKTNFIFADVMTRLEVKQKMYSKWDVAHVLRRLIDQGVLKRNPITPVEQGILKIRGNIHFQYIVGSNWEGYLKYWGLM